jgi:uncharacterized membrane protein YfcA
MMTWQTLLALGAAGAAAGFVDAIAGGGGLLTVPALLWAGLPPQLALGTNKLQSSCGTALATWRYARAGLLRAPRVVLGVVITFGAAMAGAWVVNRMDPKFLYRLVPILLLGIAIYVAVRRNFGAEPGPARMPAGAFAALFGILLGFYDGFFGPGTGTFWTMACVYYLGMDLARATGYTKAMNLASNIASLVIFLIKGQVDFQVGAVMAVGQLAGAKLGSGLVIRGGSRFIRPIFLSVVIVLTLRLAWKAFQNR